MYTTTTTTTTITATTITDDTFQNSETKEGSNSATSAMASSPSHCACKFFDDSWDTLCGGCEKINSKVYNPQSNKATDPKKQYQPKTKKELKQAIREYQQGKHKERGEPNDWDVSLITDMSQLFLDEQHL